DDGRESRPESPALAECLPQPSPPGGRRVEAGRSEAGVRRRGRRNARRYGRREEDRPWTYFYISGTMEVCQALFPLPTLLSSAASHYRTSRLWKPAPFSFDRLSTPMGPGSFRHRLANSSNQASPFALPSPSALPRQPNQRRRKKRDLLPLRWTPAIRNPAIRNRRERRPTSTT